MARAASCMKVLFAFFFLASIASASTCHVGVHIPLKSPGLAFFFSLTTAALLAQPLLQTFWRHFASYFETTCHIGAGGDHPFLIPI